MSRKFVTFVVVLFFSQAVVASKLVEKSVQNSIVEDYKDLRKQCAISKGSERVRCFRELKQKNGKYQLAKRVIASEEPEDFGNLHIVSNVY